MFNNATKQDRYKQMNKASRPGPPARPLKAAPETLRPDLLLNAGPPRPVPVASPTVVVSGSAAQQQKPVYVTGARGGMWRSVDGKPVYEEGSATGEYSYMPSDLASAMEKNEKMRASQAGVAWNPEVQTPSENRSYERSAANQRADLQVNAVVPDNSGKPKTLIQTMRDILTTPYSENSPWAPF
jgi:hypothetical protein